MSNYHSLLLPTLLTVFFLGMVYCLINPIISPTLLIFFVMEILAQRYNEMYVYVNQYESGGKIWSVVSITFEPLNVIWEADAQEHI